MGSWASMVSPLSIINIIKNTYHDTTCAVKAEGSLSSWFRIITGVRQSDMWSPLLLGLAVDFVKRTAVDKDKRGLTLMPRGSSRQGGGVETDWPGLYAGDIAVFEETDVEMAKIYNWSHRYIAEKLGLKMSFKKTEIMSVGRASVSNPVGRPTPPSW